MQACASACECAALIILAAEAHRPLGRIIITALYLTARFAMQVARSLRIRSHYLAMPAVKARRTQAYLHVATTGNVGLYTDTSLLPEGKMQANPFSSDAHSPKQMAALSAACRPAPAENRMRVRMRRRSVEHYADRFSGNA